MVKDRDVEKLLKERQDDRIGLLKESITDIQQMIIGREELHNEMLKSLDEIDMFINNSMPKSGGAAMDANTRQDLMKELLKKKIEIEELKVEEKLNFWRDRAMLKKELREYMKEIGDMQSKTTMMDTILDV